MDEKLFTQLSDILEEKNININQLLHDFNGFSSKNQNENDTISKNNNEFDPLFIIQIQKLLSSLNKNNSEINLLNSLKPYIKKSQQEKIDIYIKIIRIFQVFSEIQESGGNNILNLL